MEKSTADSFEGLALHQPQKGYRYSIDPLLLAAHINPSHSLRITDIGCGCGIIPLILACRYPFLHITGIEIQRELAQFARHNIKENSFENRINILNKDINLLIGEGFNTKADIIVSNPPYQKKGTGRINPNPQKAVARHEITLDLDQLFTAAHHLLTESGRFYLIYPAHRLPDIVKKVQWFSMGFDFIRPVHIKAKQNAVRVIVCIKKQENCDGRIRHPFYLYSPENNPTDEYLSLFKP